MIFNGQIIDEEPSVAKSNSPKRQNEDSKIDQPNQSSFMASRIHNSSL